MTQFIEETEPFRIFRLTNFQARSATDGELLGVFLRRIVEMATWDQSGAAIDHLRHQADLLEAMLPPRAERPPAPKRHPRPPGVLRRSALERLGPGAGVPFPHANNSAAPPGWLPTSAGGTYGGSHRSGAYGGATGVDSHLT